jgi:hypothetical protein
MFMWSKGEIKEGPMGRVGGGEGLGVERNVAVLV